MTTAPAPMGPIQKAVYTRLAGDAAYMALVAGGPYDGVPEQAALPCTDLGEFVETPDNRHRGFGRQTVITLHTWSRERGYAEVQRIGAAIMAALDHQPLSIDGEHHVDTLYEFGQTLTDPDPVGDVRHLVQRFRILTEQP